MFMLEERYIGGSGSKRTFMSGADLFSWVATCCAAGCLGAFPIPLQNPTAEFSTIFL